MRQLTTLPDANQAQALADYLLTLRIDTRLDRQAEGCVIWVCDEDQIPQAQQELTRFRENPNDSRYTTAARTARSLRQQEEQQEEEFRRRQIDLRLKMSEPPATGGRRVTGVLLAVSILVTVLIYSPDPGAFLSLSGEPKGALLPRLTIVPWPTNPAGGPTTLPEELAVGQVWRLVTPIFIHFGILHLGFNMWMLLVLGVPVEENRGPVRYLLLVLSIAVVSNVAQYYLGNTTWGPAGLVLRPSGNFGGMSGVLYGLFGYVWMKSRFQPQLGLTIDANTVIYLVVWFFVCMTGAVGHVANVAHAAGLVFGILVGIVPALWRSRP